MNPPVSKKVLLVITKSNWGGAQHYVFTLAKNLRERGNEVVVALGGTGLPGAPTGQLATRLTEEGIRTIFLETFARDISITREWHAFQELVQVVRKEQPDVLHLNSSKAGGLGALAGRVAGVRHIVFTAHGWAHREPIGALKRLSIWLVSWLTIVLSHTIIVVSQNDYDTAPVFFSHKKIVLIHNGIQPFSLLSKEEARAAFLLKAPLLPKDDTWILSTSELHPNKSVKTTIASFACIAHDFPMTSLVIIGSGEQEAELQTYAKELHIDHRVFFLGFLENAKAYLTAGEIFVLPSKKEGFPFALLEAGFAGLAVIASRTGGIPELITDHETGLLIQPASVHDLEMAYAAVLSDDALRIQLGNQLHERVVHDFSEKEMITKTLESYA